MTCKIPRTDIPHILVAQVNKSFDYPPKLKLIGRGQSDSWLSTKNFRIIRGMRPTFLRFAFFCAFQTANEIKSVPNWHNSTCYSRTVKFANLLSVRSEMASMKAIDVFDNDDDEDDFAN